MSRKGFIRTLEAIIAVILIITAIFFILPQRTEFEAATPVPVQEAQEFINTKILQDEQLIRLIIGEIEPDATNQLKALIENALPPGYGYVLALCKTPSCLPSPTTPLPEGKQVYMSDLFLGSTPTTQGPHIVRYWMWQQG